MLPARMSNDVDSKTTETSLSSVPFNPDETSNPADPWPTSSQNKTKSTKIRIMNSFNTVVEGRLLEFQLSMRVQLAKSLNISESVFTRIIARNGSILLKVEMSSIHGANTSVEVEQAHSKLGSMLKQGSLVLTDLNSTKLNVPPQQNGQVLTDETGGYSNIFIGVTAASLSSTFLLIFWVVWNLKKNKTINPMGGHSERLNSQSLFMTKQSTDNLGLGRSPGLRRNSNNKFTTFAESEAQWEIFQQHFPSKPDYVWKSQSDETVWAGIDHQVQWPQLLDAPDEESVPITSRTTKQ